MSGYPVVLNVYDMYWINQYTFPVGLGVFHSGVVVHGKEYAFGGHPNNWSGIFEMSPKSVEVLGDDFKFRNCNHFTSEFCQALCNKSIPAWVNRLASVGSYLPFLLKCIPREWISPEPCSPTRSPSYVSHPFKDCTGSDEDDQPRTKTKHR
ncbi:desumoylating isopeptidase 2-like isoform X4 [Orbicella faveolata]|uniref:desumoylating isopeptidase 2-like isoform X4 n=1 Tax=Orbicella faveolata TaxID=48498 RepID=UPI0009E2FBFF|nr:desumoylating isopeptidase 2-like isoform X4 [Orbicella faveolata]